MSSRAIQITGQNSSVTKLTFYKRNVFWVIVASIVILAPALVYGIPSNTDLSNHFRFALPFYDSLQSGHLYPGWLAESNAGYGDASFRFYPPGTYYLLAGTRALTGSWYSGSLLSFALMFASGGLGMYLWTREFVSSQMAMWAGILYTVAPYRLNQLYQAFMLAEFAGAAILPFTFLFTERVCARGRPRDVAALATSYAILVFTHLPLAVIGSIALFVYALFRLRPRKQWKTLIWLAASAGLGLAASACYWATMVAELGWIRADNLKPYPFVDYRNNFLLSTFSPENLNVWWMNILLLATLAMFWPGLVLFRRSTWQTIPPRGVKAAAVLLLFTLVMATPPSVPIWNLLRPLQETQFPWRWLTLTSLACPVLFASAIPFWVRLWHEKKRPLVIVAAGTIAISLSFSVSHTIREAQYLNRAEFDATLRTVQGSQSVTQWWPRWVNEPLKEMRGNVDAGPRNVLVKSWQPEIRGFAVGPGEAREVRLRTFYYPNWVATSGGHPLAIRPDADGAMLVSVPAERTDIVLEFREPSRVRWAAILTVLGWIAIVALTFGARKGLRHSSFREVAL